ncbi:MAG: hypothetical protein IJ390_07600 [Lachnospiraceae bacterium]|nr:hypothetical protein [Lachnospiraceae bacterium]
MKIKCSKCGKNFEPDMYSGLCPKCGTYNGAKRTESDITQYLNNSNPGEESHQKLHRDYDSVIKEQSHRKLHESYDENRRKVHPETIRKPVTNSAAAKSGISGVRIFFTIVLIAIPLIFFLSFQMWKTALFSKMKGNGKIESVEQSDDYSITFDHEEMEFPVRVELKQAGRVNLAGMLPEGKSFVVVRAAAQSTDYSFDAGVSFVALQYEYEGNTYYRTPVDWYDLKSCSRELGIKQDDILSSYRLGNGSADEGYWFFSAEDGATDLKLVLMAQTQSYPNRVLAEGTIDLAGLDRISFTDREVE